MRHRRTREVFIELTSLLDVVMILIFAVMIQTSQLSEKSQAEVQELEDNNARLELQLEEKEKELAELQNKYDELAIEKAELELENEELKKKLEELEQKLSALEENYEDIKALMDASENVELLKDLENAKQKLEIYEYMKDNNIIGDRQIVISMPLDVAGRTRFTCDTLTENSSEKGKIDVANDSVYSGEAVESWNTIFDLMTDFIRETVDKTLAENDGTADINIIVSFDKSKINAKLYDKFVIRVNYIIAEYREKGTAISYNIMPLNG